MLRRGRTWTRPNSLVQKMDSKANEVDQRHKSWVWPVAATAGCRISSAEYGVHFRTEPCTCHFSHTPANDVFPTHTDQLAEEPEDFPPDG